MYRSAVGWVWRADVERRDRVVFAFEEDLREVAVFFDDAFFLLLAALVARLRAGFAPMRAKLPHANQSVSKLPNNF